MGASATSVSRADNHPSHRHHRRHSGHSRSNCSTMGNIPYKDMSLSDFYLYFCPVYRIFIFIAVLRKVNLLT